MIVTLVYYRIVFSVIYKHLERELVYVYMQGIVFCVLYKAQFHKSGIIVGIESIYMPLSKRMLHFSLSHLMGKVSPVSLLFSYFSINLKLYTHKRMYA